ncbi:DEAD/DEAH box helicase [Spongorhabdus nitratireducens]
MNSSHFIITEKFPQPGLSAEKKVWNSLSRQFASDTCLAYWRYPLFSNVGERRKEPDILMLHQSLGVVVIEVKALKIDQITGIDGHLWQFRNFYTDSGSPYEQAENHLFEFLAMSDRQPELRRRVAGRALVALPEIKRSEWQAKGFDKHPCCPPVIFKDDLGEGLNAVISNAVTAQPGQILDDGKWQRLCSVAGNTSVLKTPDPEVVQTVVTKADAIAKAKQTIARLDTEQETAAKQIPDGPQRIRGIAGSGKTVLLCQKAAQMHLKHPDWDIALVFFTRSLYDSIIDLIDRYVRQFTNGEQRYNSQTSRLKVFHAWGAQDQPGLYGEVCNSVGCRKMLPREFSRETPISARLGLAINKMRNWLEQHNRTIPPIYDAILIDEGQDLVFDPQYKEHGVQPFYWMAYNFCKPVKKQEQQIALFEAEAETVQTKRKDFRRLIWAYDEAQCLESPIIPKAREVFGEELGKMLVGQYEGGIKRSIIMHRCYRTPGPILTAAHAIGMGLMREQGMISGVTNREAWKDLGYDVSGRFTSGEQICLQRPAENSPNPIPVISELPSVELKFYQNRQQEAQEVANKIQSDIQQHKLTPKKQLLIVVFSTESEQLVTSALNQRGINYYIPSATQANTHNIRWPDNDPNRFWHQGAVTVSRIHRAKGNEAEMVYVMGLDEIARNENSQKHRNQLFVAMTRAKGWLHISGMEMTSPFYDEFRSVLEADGKYQFIYRKKPLRDLSDLDLSPEWSEVTKEVPDDYHSLIIKLADHVKTPVLSYEITAGDRVVAQPLLCWPDERVAIVEFSEQLDDFKSLKKSESWTVMTLARAVKNFPKLIKALKG